MKFLIEIETLTDQATVTNLNDFDYKGYFAHELKVLAPKEQMSLTVALAKNKFGDWDKDDDFYERQRRNNLGISLFEIEVREIHAPVAETQKTAQFSEEVEPEFTFLDALNAETPEKQPETVEEPLKCLAKTKKGTACKANPLENGFCLAHQKLAKGE